VEVLHIPARFAAEAPVAPIARGYDGLIERAARGLSPEAREAFRARVRANLAGRDVNDETVKSAIATARAA
jgi:hypothetical protein